MMLDIERLSSCLNYVFSDEKLLRQALTHRSYASSHYERLEFLGDNVLGVSISYLLIKKFPDLDEGGLSHLRSRLISRDALYLVAQDLNLKKYILVNSKEDQAVPASILSDVVEAILGAVFLDGGYECAFILVFHLFQKYIDNLYPGIAKDPKTQLQEWLQSQKMFLPTYIVYEITGEAHDQMFHVLCSIQSSTETRGSGTSRRLAEQKAASAMLIELGLSGVTN